MKGYVNARVAHEVLDPLGRKPLIDQPGREEMPIPVQAGADAALHNVVERLEICRGYPGTRPSGPFGHASFRSLKVPMKSAS